MPENCTSEVKCSKITIDVDPDGVPLIRFDFVKRVSDANGVFLGEFRVASKVLTGEVVTSNPNYETVKVALKSMAYAQLAPPVPVVEG